MRSDSRSRVEPESTNSDENVTAMATITFEKILKEIQSSNLNFQLQVSPFSAQISLKKSLVREGEGTLRIPPSSPHLSTTQQDEQAQNLEILSHELKEAIDECAMKNEELVKSKETISMLENKFSKAEAETLRIFEEKKTEVDILKRKLKL